MENDEKRLIYGKEFEEEPVDLFSIDNRDPDGSSVAVRGKISHISRKDTAYGRPIVRFRITDYTDIRPVEFFVADRKERADLLKLLKKGTFIMLKGELAGLDFTIGIVEVKGIYLIPEFDPPEREE